jgi:hypothetical protein
MGTGSALSTWAMSIAGKSGADAPASLLRYGTHRIARHSPVAGSRPNPSGSSERSSGLGGSPQPVAAGWGRNEQFLAPHREELLRSPHPAHVTPTASLGAVAATPASAAAQASMASRRSSRVASEEGITLTATKQVERLDR